MIKKDQRNFLIVATSVLVVVALGVWFAIAGGSERNGRIGGLPLGGAFSLTNQLGETVTDEAMRGRYMLIYFGYSFCPDVCPAALQVMSQALDHLGKRARRVAPVFITIDPERDTPDHLKLYLENFHPRMLGLTGTPEQIKKVAKAYRVYYRRVDSPETTNYLMDHTSVYYLIGPKGTFVTHFNHGTTARQIADRLADIL